MTGGEPPRERRCAVTESKRGGVGCLVIDNLRPGENSLSGLLSACGARPFGYEWRPGAPLMDQLRTLLHRARVECGAASILARGTGCGAALALAEQLPVERLALIEPGEALRPFRSAHAMGATRATGVLCASDRRQLCRINAFARRNLSLCVSDTLVIEGERSDGWRRLDEGGLSAHSRLYRLAIDAESGEIMYTNCENALKRAIIAFLCAGDLPKDLAENREMCITYN